MYTHYRGTFSTHIYTQGKVPGHIFTDEFSCTHTHIIATQRTLTVNIFSLETGEETFTHFDYCGHIAHTHTHTHTHAHIRILHTHTHMQDTHTHSHTNIYKA